MGSRVRKCPIHKIIRGFFSFSTFSSFSSTFFCTKKALSLFPRFLRGQRRPINLLLHPLPPNTGWPEHGITHKNSTNVNSQKKKSMSLVDRFFSALLSALGIWETFSYAYVVWHDVLFLPANGGGGVCACVQTRALDMPHRVTKADTGVGVGKERQYHHCCT